MPKMMIQLLALALAMSLGSVHALTAEQAKAMTIGEGDSRIDALRSAVGAADDNTVRLIQALADDAVKIVAGAPVIVQNDKAVDPVTGVEAALPDTAEDVMNNNRMRGEIDNALAAFKLMSVDAAVRREAVKTLQGEVDEGKLALIDKVYASETESDMDQQFRRIQTAKKDEIHIILFKDKKILDDAVLDEIKSEINRVLGNAAGPDVLLDFSNVEFMSSAMLGLLGQLHRKISGGKGRLKMCGIRPEIFQVFKLTNLDKLFKIYKDAPAGLTAFAS